MSIHTPAHARSGVPGRIAMLALAAGLGVLVGSTLGPLWDAGGSAHESSVNAEPSTPSGQVVFTSEGAIRANEATLEAALGDGWLFSIGWDGVANAPIRDPGLLVPPAVLQGPLYP